jgi:hypothetical protein
LIDIKDFAVSELPQTKAGKDFHIIFTSGRRCRVNRLLQCRRDLFFVLSRRFKFDFVAYPRLPTSRRGSMRATFLTTFAELIKGRYKPMPFDMEFDTETIDTNEQGDQLADSITTADLLALRERLSNELADSIMDGDTAKLLRLDQQLKSLEPRLFAAKLENLKQMIELNAGQKADVIAEIDALRQLRQDLNRKLVRAMDLHRLRGERVIRAEFLLQVAETNLKSIRVSDGELKQKLEQIKENKLNEVKRYETEFRTNF